MIKQIAVISGPCLALSWVHTHTPLCGEALKPGLPNVQAEVLRGKTTSQPPIDTCITFTKLAALVISKTD